MTEFKQPTFCSQCQVHLAMPLRPLCPPCADDRARELRERSKEIQ